MTIASKYGYEYDYEYDMTDWVSQTVRQWVWVGDLCAQRSDSCTTSTSTTTRYYLRLQVTNLVTSKSESVILRRL